MCNLGTRDGTGRYAGSEDLGWFGSTAEAIAYTLGSHLEMATWIGDVQGIGRPKIVSLFRGETFS